MLLLLLLLLLADAVADDVVAVAVYVLLEDNVQSQAERPVFTCCKPTVASAGPRHAGAAMQAADAEFAGAIGGAGAATAAPFTGATGGGLR